MNPREVGKTSLMVNAKWDLDRVACGCDVVNFRRADHARLVWPESKGRAEAGRFITYDVCADIPEEVK